MGNAFCFEAMDLSTSVVNWRAWGETQINIAFNQAIQILDTEQLKEGNKTNLKSTRTNSFKQMTDVHEWLLSFAYAKYSQYPNEI